MAARRRWVIVLFGVAIFVVFVGIGVIIAVTAWFQQNLQVEQRSEQDAVVQFDEVRKKFGGRAPLLEMHEGRPRYTGERSKAAAPAATLDSLHVLVWDPDDGALSRFTLPFWLLRLKSDPIRFGAYASGLDDDAVDLRPDDIEKYGPGIILDMASRSGDRVLLWAQ
jgi:hypothetical protein